MLLFPYARLASKLERSGCIGVAVVIDFDLTLTTGTSEECHDIIGTSPAMPLAVREKFFDLLDFSKPFPPELEGALWWERANEILLESKEDISPAMIREAAITADVSLRPGAKELLCSLVELSVPVLVCSAGVSDVIEAVLEDAGVPIGSSECDDVLSISSNRLVFQDGRLQSVVPSPPITSLNKGLSFERNRKWFEAARRTGRTGLLVLGDRISDLTVAAGAPDNAYTIASVGIYNDTPHGPATTIDDFEPKFDAVIRGDEGSLDPVRALVHELEARH